MVQLLEQLLGGGLSQIISPCIINSILGTTCLPPLSNGIINAATTNRVSYNPVGSEKRSSHILPEISEH